ncbi:protein of unknown function, might belong to Peptidase M28 [Shewanella benthica]|uniref:Uncharacterized protein n=1 Tax=Shewanella benthica TaxID=43661 RepID=A0A330MBI6_9GAMM|nr:protein of unknown function, might belong to Peptidase M28 [Shewanella benthica]
MIITAVGGTIEKIDLKFLAAASESAYQLLIIDSLTLK